jgi:hypothetical protein
MNHASKNSVALLIVAGLCLNACSRARGAPSAQAPDFSAQPMSMEPQSSKMSQTAAPAPAGSQVLSASLPLGTATSGVSPLVVISDHSQTFTVAQHTYRLLTHIQRIEAANKQTAEETTEWWELRNSKDQVIYREAYPVVFQDGTFESTVEISAMPFTTQQGSGMLVQGLDLPSAPGTGSWLEVFGFKYGREKYGADETLFGRFGAPISIEGEFLDIGTDSLRPTPPFLAGASVTTMRDVLRFRVWTGNFSIEYPVLINWITGTLQPAWRCIETTSKGPSDRCSYPVQVEAQRANQVTFVRFFPEADEGFTPKHLVLQGETKIEYLEAKVPMTWSEDNKAISFGVDGDVWLKIRVNGQEGWIHSEEDFEAVGLPQSG